jgi:predicted transposase/invertase (TIGR01784 family)
MPRHQRQNLDNRDAMRFRFFLHQESVVYACGAYLNQRIKDHDYDKMKPVIFFAILKRKLFPDKKEYLSHHKVSDICTGESDIKDLSFSFLELGKFQKRFGELTSNVEKWAYFFKHAQETEPQELEEIHRCDRIIGIAYDALSQSAFYPEALLEYERYAMKENEIFTRLSDAEKRGIEKSKAEGALSKARETA